MSEILTARILQCLTNYDVAAPTHLDLDELAAELLDAVLPMSAAEYEHVPIWWRMVLDLDICTNCHTRVADCACCIGCGGTDSDIIGSHGSWCAL